MAFDARVDFEDDREAAREHNRIVAIKLIGAMG